MKDFYEPTLIPDVESEGSDYVLVGNSCWITVESISVYVRRTPDGVRVDLYPHFKEDDDHKLLDTAFATFEAAEEDK